MEVVRREPFGGPRVGDRGVTTRRSILDAALVVFRDHGFHGAKVELITETAGCSRPAFYQYFSSKEEVFWCLARELARKMAELGATIEISTPDDAGVRAVERWIELLIDLQTTFAPIIDSFPAAVREPTEQFSASRRTTARLGDAIVDSAPADQRLGGLDALPAVAATIALRTIHFWTLGLSPIPRDGFVHDLAHTMHRLLHGPIAGINLRAPEPAPVNTRTMPPFPRRDHSSAPSRARGRETRNLLLGAATRTLARCGYHATRVDDIVAEANISHGSFYRYFSSKDDVFGVLAERAATSMFDLATTLTPSNGPAALKAWLITYFDLYRDNGGVISAWQEIGYGESPLNSFATGVAAAVFDQLRLSFRDRGPGLSAVDGLALLGVIERVPYLVYTLDTIDTDEAIEATAYFVQRALMT